MGLKIKPCRENVLVIWVNNEVKLDVLHNGSHVCFGATRAETSDCRRIDRDLQTNHLTCRLINTIMGGNWAAILKYNRGPAYFS